MTAARRARGATRARAVEVALGLLARRAYGEREMQAALERRGVAKSEARRAVSRLRRLGYLDDRQLAADVVERLRDRGCGSLAIRERLARHGVDEKLAERVAPDARDERVAATRLLRSRFGDEGPAEGRDTLRAARWLVSRGFPESVVAAVLGLENAS